MNLLRRYQDDKKKKTTSSNKKSVENLGRTDGDFGNLPDKTNFEKRIEDPKLFIENPDGTKSTHKMMSFETDGKYYAAPTIIEKDGKLVELDEDAAYEHAMRTKEYKEFTTEAEAQAYASGGYKKGTPLEEQPNSVVERSLEDKTKYAYRLQTQITPEGKKIFKQVPYSKYNEETKKWELIPDVPLYIDLRGKFRRGGLFYRD